MRVDWNPDSELFEYRDTISTIGARTRPVASSLGPDGSVYVVFQRSGTVQRIARPAAGRPGRPGRRHHRRRAPRERRRRRPRRRGSHHGLDRRGRGHRPPTPRTRSRRPPPSPRASPCLPAPRSARSLSDLGRDHLWVGTANGTTQADAGIDAVAPVHDVRSRRRAAARLRDGLLDDRRLRAAARRCPPRRSTTRRLLDPAEPIGTGHMFHVGLPAAHILRGPLSADGTESPDRAFTNSSHAGVHDRRRGHRRVQPPRPRHHGGVGRVPCPTGASRPPPRWPTARTASSSAHVTAT